MWNLETYCTYQKFYITYYKTHIWDEARKSKLSLKMQFVWYFAKLVTNNILEGHRNLVQGLIIIGERIVTIVKQWKLNNSHSTLILQMVFIAVKVTGKSDFLISKIVQKVFRRKNHFVNMNLTISSQMIYMSM